MLGIFIILSMTPASYSASSFSFSTNSSLIFFTSNLIASASSFLPCFIKLPISELNELRLERSSSPFNLDSLFLESSSITSSTKVSLWSWNFFLMFSLTTSGFSLKNLISIIIYLLTNKSPYAK